MCQLVDQGDVAINRGQLSTYQHLVCAFVLLFHIPEARGWPADDPGQAAPRGSTGRHGGVIYEGDPNPISGRVVYRGAPPSLHDVLAQQRRGSEGVSDVARKARRSRQRLGVPERRRQACTAPRVASSPTAALRPEGLPHSVAHFLSVATYLTPGFWSLTSAALKGAYCRKRPMNEMRSA